MENRPWTTIDNQYANFQSMAQPIKKQKITGPFNKPRSKTVKKKSPTVGEIIRKKKDKGKKPHPDYGTSKLETKFAKEFLDKLGVKYERQFYAEDIKRYYDFYLPEQRVLIEVDGTYYHGYGLLYEDMNPMQKHNNRVNKNKNEWAAEHSIPLIRIWEHDINNHPSKVLTYLKKRIGIADAKKKISDDKKKRH